MKTLLHVVILFVLSLNVFAFDFVKESNYQNACDRGDMSSCVMLGTMYHLGDGVSQNFSRARELYAQACNGGLAEGCSHLGFMYENGHTTQNYTKAIEFYEKACDLGDANGCASVAKIYENIKEDALQAFTYYDKACDGGDGESCVHIALLYAEKGDNHASADYYEKGCEHSDASACLNLGTMYYQGTGRWEDAQKALELFEKACTLGSESGCKNYKLLKDSGF